VIEDKDADELYIIMEYAPGGTLQSLIDKGISED